LSLREGEPIRVRWRGRGPCPRSDTGNHGALRRSQHRRPGTARPCRDHPPWRRGPACSETSTPTAPRCTA